MAKTIHLHGGPWHDRVLAVPEVITFIIIGGLMHPIQDFREYTDGEGATKPTLMRKGTYSMVGRSLDFEWDGWKS